MKSYILLFLFSTVNALLFAQVQITQADVENIFAPGKSWIDFSSDDPQVSMDIGSASGTSQSWTIPNIAWSDTNISTNVSPGSTPYQANFPNATHAQFATGNFEDNQASEYTYFQVASDGIYELGTALETNLGGIDTVIIHSGQQLVFPFPLTYGLALGESRDSMAIVEGIYTIRTKTQSVDAFGTLTFPSGTFQALRVSSIEQTTVYLNGIQISQYYSSSFTWIAKDGGTFETEIDSASSTSGNIPLSYASMTQFNYVSSAGEDELTIPTSFHLYHNYPNPFNPTTNIKYAVPQTEFVSLKVYDILGKEVAVLVNEIKSPGTYDVVFNASNLSSGIYFYRLKATGSTNISLTKKLILIK